MGKSSVSTIKLQPNERLTAICKEYHTRKQNGQLVAWIIEDKLSQYVIMCQKISSAIGWLNQNVLLNRADRLSVSGMYQMSLCEGGEGSITGGFSKHRWRIRPYRLGEAADQFNSMRGGFEQSVIVGASNCYHISV
jgi:hypothetical protein